LIAAISGVDEHRARLTDAVPEVANTQGALMVVVSHDQVVDYGVHERAVTAA
jgi:hypothetical protein